MISEHHLTDGPSMLTGCCELVTAVVLSKLLKTKDWRLDTFLLDLFFGAFFFPWGGVTDSCKPPGVGSRNQIWVF